MWYVWDTDLVLGIESEVSLEFSRPRLESSASRISGCCSVNRESDTVAMRSLLPFARRSIGLP